MFVLMQRALRAGRRATFTYFALNGFVMGMWIVHIPVIEHRTGIGHAVLGWLLLLLGAGAFAGMRITGPLADRYSPRTVVPVSAALCCAAVVLPGLADDVWTLGGALLLLGFGNGCLDVAMNAHAVQVERGYDRPIMAAFHAMFSVGGVLAALAGARALGWGWDPLVTLGATAVLGLIVAGAAASALLPIEPALLGRDGPERPTVRRPSGRVWGLAALALMLMLCEGVANDWSVLHLSTVLDAPAATAAFAYGAFATAMTVGRFLTDRVSGRFGPVVVVRYGAGVAAVGLTAAALSPWVPLALAGWGVFGLGLSGCVPQLFSAAGHSDQGNAATNVSRVASLGYLGMLAGPTVIGPLTHLVPLNLTFLLPVAFCVVAVAAAGTLRPRPASPAPVRPERDRTAR